MKNILLLGASGRTGIQVLNYALLDWTLVRPVGLNNTDKEMGLAIGSQDKHSAFISRKAVAQFLVDCLETNGYIKKAAIISEKK